jgi:hypothetical protein
VIHGLRSHCLEDEERAAEAVTTSRKSERNVYRLRGNSKYSHSVILEISVFCGMTPCTLVDRYQTVLRHIIYGSILGVHISVWKRGNGQNERW